MKLLVVVLNKVEMLEPILETLTARGIRGATILNSTGMLKELTKTENLPLFGSLRFLADPTREESKTMLMVLNDEKLNIAKQTMRDMLGDLSKPNTAIMFSLNINDAEGLTL